MSQIKLLLPIAYFPDPTNGDPVSLGDVYVGVKDLDPEILANRVTVTVIEGDGTQIPISGAMQPLNTGAAGIIIYNGSPVTVLVDGEYSLKVNDSTGSQVYYVANGAVGAGVGIDDQATSTKITITDTETTVNNDIDINTNKRITFGSLSESFILHNSTSMVINNEVGDMFVQNFGASALIKVNTKNSAVTTGEAMTIGGATQGVTLNYDFIPKVSTSSLGLDLLAATTEASVLSVGFGRAGNGLSIINMVGDTTYTVYGLRFLRLTGPDGGSQIRHRGLGGLDLIAEEAAPINFFTSATIKSYIDADGGLVGGTPTGLSQGAGSGNFESLYVNGTAVALQGSTGAIPGTNQTAYDPFEDSNSTSTPKIAYQYEILRDGEYTFNIEALQTASSGANIIRVYRNGVAVGVGVSTNSSTYVPLTENIAGWVVGDVMTLRFYSTSTTASMVRNFGIAEGNPLINPLNTKGSPW